MNAVTNIFKIRNLFDKNSSNFDEIMQQESCAIAKMTAQCAIYMGALKIFGTP